MLHGGGLADLGRIIRLRFVKNAFEYLRAHWHQTLADTHQIRTFILHGHAHSPCWHSDDDYTTVWMLNLGRVDTHINALILVVLKLSQIGIGLGADSATGALITDAQYNPTATFISQRDTILGEFIRIVACFCLFNLKIFALGLIPKAL